MPVDPAIRDHQAWLGYLQPDGLVVSAAALVDSQVVLDRSTASLQHRFLDFVDDVRHDGDEIPAITNLGRFLHGFLEWPDDCVDGAVADRPIPESLKIPLREFSETLEPTFAFRSPRPENSDRPWLLLVQDLPISTSLDEPIESKLAGWSASPSRRFERLLRESEVPIGLLSNGTHLRLIYAPRGENAGTLTFPVVAMSEVAGRPVLAAFHILLSRYRLLAAPSEARLPALLKRSRDYQARVSTALAGQVLDALYELLRGFQAADDHTHGRLLKDVLANDPDQVYGGLLTVLMRLVFLLYAEDQGLMPGSDLYVRNYAIHGLFERLRADAEQFPDTMQHRYGAWAQLLALFRTIHRGCQHGLLKMPAREGHLFDPDRYPFLEAGVIFPPSLSRDGHGEAAHLPLVPDGTIFRILEKLLLLDGERLSYRTLDVEQIGSVYETMMGFRMERASGAAIALKPAKAHGAPVPVNLDELLTARPVDRAKYIQERTDYKLTANMAASVKEADSIESLLAALDQRIARNATPQPVAEKTMLLAPTDERRKTGSHYTPRSLTEPIVRKTLEPILKSLGEAPTPQQILDLNVCDPAMGSGAFLVEACRQLADALVAAWAAHGYKPYIPPDEDEILHARRLIAQRCLYGVDRNPMAVDLAKLALWLATLAKDHPFTFLDHNLRAGDSLVGLTRKQIIGFDLEPSAQIGFVEAKVRDRMNAATAARRTILEAGDDMLPGMKQQKLRIADEALDLIRLAGDAVVAAFFAGNRPKERKAKRDELFNLLDRWIQRSDADARRQLGEAVYRLRERGPEHLPVTPFHWEIEFPEVFTSSAAGHRVGGFDAIVGNPPFIGGKRISGSLGSRYGEWVKLVNPGSSGNTDLVAHFYRRAFNNLRDGGAFGLIATNTIAQGDTRRGGLTWITKHGGVIVNARRRVSWPGAAAVVVSVVTISKGPTNVCFQIDGRHVGFISAFLFADGTNDDPIKLKSNERLSFIGCDIKGQGFLFDDADGNATPLRVLRELTAIDPRNTSCVLPYLGGEELLDAPAQSPRRFVIHFHDWPLRRDQLGNAWATADEPIRRMWLRAGVVPLDYPDEVAADYPLLLAIVESKVKPERATKSADLANWPWWRFWRVRGELQRACVGKNRVLVVAQTGNALAFAFITLPVVFSHTVVVFPLDSWSFFAAMQSQVHRLWALFFAATMKDDARYIPEDCFAAFPFPGNYQADARLKSVGEEYYHFRAALMLRNNEGLTRTYNRFHDPSETSPDIQRLRDLHATMDRAMLDAYGWTDLKSTCEFLLDYEEVDEGEEAEAGRTKKKKKPWRYRWPDEFRDEVLARLLALNAERAAAERRSGAEASAADKKKAVRGKVAAPAKPHKADVGVSEAFPTELDRNHQYVLMLLRAWDGRPLTRRALNAGMILMLNDQLRTALLDNDRAVTGRQQNTPDLNHIYTELSIDGFISLDNSGAQQVVQITETAPITDDAAVGDADRLNAVKEYFRREAVSGKAALTDETVDAEFDFVPA
jgi:hypothetical protein